MKKISVVVICSFTTSTLLLPSFIYFMEYFFNVQVFCSRCESGNENSARHGINKSRRPRILAVIVLEPQAGGTYRLPNMKSYTRLARAIYFTHKLVTEQYTAYNYQDKGLGTNPGDGCNYIAAANYTQLPDIRVQEQKGEWTRVVARGRLRPAGHWPAVDHDSPRS